MRMKISIVIVNYNVRYFLEQCLISVEKAMHRFGHNGEVWMVDNNSVDGSVQMVRERFPSVKVIANTENTGFSRANNQAMREAKGEYILLLNPDTVIEEDTLQKVIEFMDAHPDAGGLGVKMVDGKGNYLPESKRGLTTPETSFYKIFGISRLFPRSKRFNRYYLGHLDADQTHEIEILSGAFMMMRKSALDKVGLLDEAFFMYGEDIDLSWRIIQGGYKNYYLPETTIIHYKGESTKKGSLNYVFVFYNAMIIFARKHFSGNNAKLFVFFIQIAIWLRASVAVLNRFLKKLFMPLLDVSFSLASLFILKDIYASITDKVYSDSLVVPAFCVMTALWMLGTWINGGYDKPYFPLKTIKGNIAVSVIILAAYSLLPEDMRFSRAMILAATVMMPIIFVLTRVVRNIIADGKAGWRVKEMRNFAIIGHEDESKRVKAILEQTYPSIGEVHIMAPAAENLSDVIRVLKINSVVFCSKDISSAAIIKSMSEMSSPDLEFKIAPPEALYIIGSNSIDTSGDVYMLDVNSIARTDNVRIKRAFDVSFGVLCIAALPLLIWIQKRPIGFFQNIIEVIIGKKTWVGFYPEASSSDFKLPRLKPGVLHPLMGLPAALINAENIRKLNIVYAKDYKLSGDLGIILKNVRRLGE
jgi:GT2 family glycosyltransferase